MKFVEESLTKQVRKGSHSLRNTAIVVGVLLLLGGSLAAGGVLQQVKWQTKHGGLAIRNYGVVWAGKLMRSGKPFSESGWTWVHEQGVKSIVTLIRGDNVDYKKYGFENVLHVPLQGQEVPSEEEAKQYLQFIQDPKDWPVDVHCAEGKDRTGMMVALARYAIDGWPMEKALDEAKTFRGGEPLAHFRIEWLKQWAATHKPGSERRPGENAPSNAK